MNKKTLLKKLSSGHKNLHSIITITIAKGLNNKIISNKWYLKDVIAHLTWYEKETINALITRSMVDNEFWNMSIDDRNELIFKNKHTKSLEEALKDYENTFAKLLSEIERLDDNELNSDDFIKRKSNKRKTYDLILGNSYYHSDDHIDILVEQFDLDY